MIFEEKEIEVKNGKKVTFRSAKVEDATMLIEYLKGTELVLNISDSETSDERLFLPVSRNKLQQTRQQYQQWLQQQRS